MSFVQDWRLLENLDSAVVNLIQEQEMLALLDDDDVEMDVDEEIEMLLYSI